jgi:hypothetical protein
VRISVICAAGRALYPENGRGAIPVGPASGWRQFGQAVNRLSHLRSNAQSLLGPIDCGGRMRFNPGQHGSNPTTFRFPVLKTFAELVARRREWIENVLVPWCRCAPLADLTRAELEWGDLAGRVDAKATLWTWAWSRFPSLVHEQLPGVDETHEVRVTLKSGEAFVGYPDNRKTEGGRLVLQASAAKVQPAESAPLSIDEIASVERV